MATVYFVRDGNGDSATNDGCEASLAAIATEFGNNDLAWSEYPPEFNNGSSANEYSDFRYVVVQVKGGETAGNFTKNGYWYIQGVSPDEFAQKVPKS